MIPTLSGAARTRVADCAVTAGRPFTPTSKQAALLRYIVGYQESFGRTPLMREMALAAGQDPSNCLTGAYPLLDGLAERGWISRALGGAIEVLHTPAIPRAPDGDPLYFIPVGAPAHVSGDRT